MFLRQAIGIRFSDLFRLSTFGFRILHSRPFGSIRAQQLNRFRPMPASSPHIFGVRHLSPAAAWHLRQLLDRVRPRLVLIEGSDDADELIPHIVSPKSKLPIAILAYTTDTPVRTFVYPLSIYSPEYQALL